jgi:glycosyltransferase involved in cell wall biosynthesis
MSGLPPYDRRVDTLFAHGDDAAAPDDLVTVTISLHNYAQFLPECLDSVAAQTHRALELIIVDDASDADDSAGVAAAWLAAHAGRFARTVLLRHLRNQGLAATRNTGFAHARGDFVFVLDADNMIYPRAIARLHAVLRAEPFAAAYTQLEFFGAERRLGYADLWRKEYFLHENFVDAMALVSRQAWQKVGGYTPIEGGWEDYDFWCKFIDHGLVAAFVPEILCRYRVHENSMLRTEHRGQRQSLAVQLTLRHPWLRVQ